MAQNQWVNVTVDPAMSKKVDNQNHNHTVVQGGSASNDLTVSWDSAKFTTLSQIRSAVMGALKTISGQIAP